MRQFKICLTFIVLLTISAKRYEAQKLTAERDVMERDVLHNKHDRDGKLFGPLGSLHPVKPGSDFKFNISRSFDVNAGDGRSHPFKRHLQPRNYQGYLQLVPPERYGHWKNSHRSQKLGPREGRSRMRYYGGRPRMMRPRPHDDLTGSYSRWIFSGEQPNKFRPPPGYIQYPPYWSPGTNPPKFRGSFNLKSSASVHRPVSVVELVKDCSACNSVPWTPLLKPSVPHESHSDLQSYGVPTIEVHHDSKAYASNDVPSTVTTPPKPVAPVKPAPVHENSPDSTIPESYGLPLGNIPIGHGLLPPINPVKINSIGLVPPPQTILSPAPSDGFLQAIPFPELSPVPIVPLHDSTAFQHVDTPDLVPPVPPQKTVSNVIFTISEQGTNQNDPLVHNHLNYPHPDPGALLPVEHQDQHSQPSSVVNNHLLSQMSGFNHITNHPESLVNLDIVKSVPLAEYTSTIEYPLQVIQSPPIIDITLQNTSQPGAVAYEKEPQTGTQKISDILFGLMADANVKKALGSLSDNGASGSKLLQHSTQIHSLGTQQPLNYPSKSTNQNGIGETNYFTGNKGLYSQNFDQADQQYPDKSTTNNAINAAQNTASKNVPWPNVGQIQFQAQSSTPLPQYQPTYETDTGLFADPTSTTWLVPAHSNIEPQWILPVPQINPDHVPYPLLPDNEGIAGIVNGQFSPSPSPQPMNESKSKKIQIIIPYTTGDNKGFDQNVLETVQTEGDRILVHGNVTLTQGTITDENETASSQNQGRVPFGQKQQITEIKVPGNLTQGKFLNDVHHVLALNIKELLKDEVEQPKTEQNIRLQKNIDNWTALEYSNHKIVAKKEPVDVISFATSVTSIPGTSISHLLLTSKKIPERYFTTTDAPKFDEPITPHFTTASVSVASKPFTASTYDTSGLYSTVAKTIPSTTTRKTTTNHRAGYTEVSKTKANQWAKLNENLVIPEDVSTKSFDTTTVTLPSSKTTSSPVKENVYVVTPVPQWESPSTSVEGSKRTTRQVTMTEKPDIQNEVAPLKSNLSKLFGNKTERAKISKFNKPKPIQKFFASTKSPPRNITKLEIVKAKSDFSHSSDDINAPSINDIFPFRNGGEIPLELVKSNSTSNASRVRITDSGKSSVKQATLPNNTEDIGRNFPNGTSSSVSTSKEKPQGQTLFDSTTQFEIQKIKIRNDASHKFTEKTVMERKGNFSTNTSRSNGDNSKGPKSENSTKLTPPKGVFGRTTKIVTSSEIDDTSYDLASLNKTIKLLKEYLKDFSGELPEEKTEVTKVLDTKYGS